MEAKVAVLGDNDFVMPYSTLGLDTYPVEDKPELVEKQAKQIVDQKYGLIVIAENIAPMADKVFQEIETKPLPAVIVVPFTAESTGFALQSLGHLLKMSLGVDIIS